MEMVIAAEVMRPANLFTIFVHLEANGAHILFFVAAIIQKQVRFYEGRLSLLSVTFVVTAVAL